AAVVGEEAVADRVQQVGLAAAGAAVNEQRIEADALRRRQRACRGGRDFVGLADDERLETVARIEIRCVWITFDGGRSLLEDQQRRWPWSVGRGHDPDIAH